MPGMLAKGGHWPPARIIATHDNECEPPEVELAWAWDRGDGGNPTGLYPDLRDPCTLGGLLALVREAKDDPCWQVLCLGDDAWSIESGDYPHEAAALVAALEAGSVRDLDWYLDEQTRETGQRWPEPCSTFVNVDPDEYPDQPACDRCGHSKGAHS
jgi:hypothetical protein